MNLNIRGLLEHAAQNMTQDELLDEVALFILRQSYGHQTEEGVTMELAHHFSHPHNVTGYNCTK